MLRETLRVSVGHQGAGSFGGGVSRGGGGAAPGRVGEMGDLSLPSVAESYGLCLGIGQSRIGQAPPEAFFELAHPSWGGDR